MEKRKPVQEFAGWLWYRRGPVLALALPCLFFFLLACLYGSGLSMVSYGTLVCGFVGALFCAEDFMRYHARKKRLDQALKGLNIVTELLPDPADSLEAQYQEIIVKLYREHGAALHRAKQRESEMTDYYTLWAHQIKTPIAALKLLLQGDRLGENRYAMEQELFRIEQYVQMVLQYLRLESMASDMLIKRYNLCDIVKQAVKKYSSGFIGRKLSLAFKEFDYDILTDEKWLLAAVEQLLSNCVKYTNEGGVSIRMERRAPGEEGVLLIRDTGIGIREEDLTRIFEKGFTGYNGRMDKKSTGIGLYLAKQILDKLSLRITAQSKVGRGTEFRIYIPIDCQVTEM